MGSAADLKISYYLLMVDGHDEALSLARYLTDHGIAATESDTAPNEVCCPVLHGTNTVDRIEKLFESWSWFWQTTASSVLGLPVYIKEC